MINREDILTMAGSFPDYTRSTVGLIASLLGAYGVRTGYGGLNEVDELLRKRKFRNVAVLFADGMGSANLESLVVPDDILLRNRVCDYSAVFPPTTVAAMATIDSGLPPIVHGRIGWKLYDSFTEAVFNPFIETQIAARVVPIQDRWKEIKGAKYRNVSPFSKGKDHCETWETLTNRLIKLTQKRGRKLIQAYWYQPDHDMHDFGADSDQATRHIQAVSAFAERFAAEAEDALLLITADHGHRNFTKDIDFCEYPEIYDCFDGMELLDMRLASFRIKEGTQEKFDSLFCQTFPECMLMTPDEALTSGLFGEGKPHAQIKNFLGDRVAVAYGDCAWFRSGERSEFRSTHSGLSKDELTVPLIAVESR